MSRAREHAVGPGEVRRRPARSGPWEAKRVVGQPSRPGLERGRGRRVHGRRVDLGEVGHGTAVGRWSLRREEPQDRHVQPEPFARLPDDRADIHPPRRRGDERRQPSEDVAVAGRRARASRRAAADRSRRPTAWRAPRRPSRAAVSAPANGPGGARCGAWPPSPRGPGAKTSMTSAPSGPVTTLWGRFDGMRHVPPGPSSRVSPSTVNVTLPETTIPICSCSWRCSGTTEPGASSTSARRQPLAVDRPGADGSRPTRRRAARRRDRRGSSRRRSWRSGIGWTEPV